MPCISNLIRKTFFLFFFSYFRHEATTARHCGVRVLAFSLITNICVMEAKVDDNDKNDDDKSDDLVDEVFDAAKEAEPMLKSFVVRLLPALVDSL